MRVAVSPDGRRAVSGGADKLEVVATSNSWGLVHGGDRRSPQTPIANASAREQQARWLGCRVGGVGRVQKTKGGVEVVAVVSMPCAAARRRLVRHRHLIT